MTQKFLFNGAVRGDWIQHLSEWPHYTQRDTLFWSPSLLLPNTNNFSTFFCQLSNFLSAKLPHPRAAVSSRFVIVSDGLPSLPYLSSSLTHSGKSSNKTFKPKKNIPEGSHQYELLKHAEATLGSGNLRMAVMLPEGEDLNEWVAVNSKHKSLPFFSNIHLTFLHVCPSLSNRN